MHADHHQAVILVFLRPGADVRQRAQAVDAGIGPEIHQHDLAAQALRASAAANSASRVAPLSSGMVPSTGRVLPATAIVLRLWRAGSVSISACSKPRGAGQRHARQKAGVQAEGDGGDARQHQHAQGAAHPFARAQRLFHRREHPPADQQRHRQRGGRARRIGQQQQGGLDAGAVDRGARQDQAQDRPGAGRPQQAGGDAQQKRRADARFARPPRRKAGRPAPPAGGSDGRPGCATAR